MRQWEAEQGSFRDRSSEVFYQNGRVYRALDAGAADNWDRLTKTRFFAEFSGQGKIIATHRTNVSPPEPRDDRRWSAVLEHDRIPFVSYPYEWSFGMLKDAALLHLDLLAAALDEGMILKDSSPYNIQWQGARATFIDIPSFEPLSQGEPWVGYRQFCRLFLYPLMLQAHLGVQFQPWLRGTLDGLDPEDVAAVFGVGRFWRPGVLTHVLLHARLQASASWQSQNLRQSLRDAGFKTELIKANVRRLRKLVGRLTWQTKSSTWSHYAERHSYGDDEFETKRDFVQRAAARRQRRLVWDLGGNLGEFSRIAAEHADYVVLVDGDALAVDRLYGRLKAEREERILPLNMNLADVSPARGWRGTERKALAERGRPDLILALALVHHLVIDANIPLPEFVDWLADLGGALVVEFVTRQDEMVQQLLRNKHDQYSDYQLPVFETCLAARFEIRERLDLKGGKRVIYYAEPR
jgi:hypothetical protein